ncbi:hypothetical protein ABZ915_46655 [Streptomyces sp. NPDC046915]|uniref:hypothetical protein n=1 Tax=Streptomyces sp. NPDC046915 TaxID=3155257 RepID=UPI00340EE12F
MKHRRALATGLAALSLAAAGVVTTGSQAQAANYVCRGRLITSHTEGGYTSQLIESTDGTQACVVTLNQTGHPASTWAFLDHYGDATSMPWDDEGVYSQFASTGWVPEHQPAPWGDSCWLWGGTPNTSAPNSIWDASFCFSY